MRSLPELYPHGVPAVVVLVPTLFAVTAIETQITEELRNDLTDLNMMITKDS